MIRRRRAEEWIRPGGGAVGLVGGAMVPGLAIHDVRSLSGSGAACGGDRPRGRRGRRVRRCNGNRTRVGRRRMPRPTDDRWLHSRARSCGHHGQGPRAVRRRLRPHLSGACSVHRRSGGSRTCPTIDRRRGDRTEAGILAFDGLGNASPDGVGRVRPLPRRHDRKRIGVDVSSRHGLGHGSLPRRLRRRRSGELAHVLAGPVVVRGRGRVINPSLQADHEHDRGHDRHEHSDTDRDQHVSG